MINTSQYEVLVHAGSNGDTYIINAEVKAHWTMDALGTTTGYCQKGNEREDCVLIN